MKIGTAQIGVAKICLTQIHTNKARLFEIRSEQVSTAGSQHQSDLTEAPYR
jgi:hypothetical protein